MEALRELLQEQHKGIPLWLDAKLEALRELFQEQHQRLRQDMHQGFDAGVVRTKSLSDELTQLRLQVDRLVTERQIEERQSLKRGTWAGILAGFLFSALMKFADVLFGGHR